MVHDRQRPGVPGHGFQYQLFLERTFSLCDTGEFNRSTRWRDHLVDSD